MFRIRNFTRPLADDNHDCKIHHVRHRWASVLSQRRPYSVSQMRGRKPSHQIFFGTTSLPLTEAHAGDRIGLQRRRRQLAIFGFLLMIPPDLPTQIKRHYIYVSHGVFVFFLCSPVLKSDWRHACTPPPPPKVKVKAKVAAPEPKPDGA